ncbi:MAG: hypothetical protein KDB21_00260 [Acidimicrobiales bacterium]|nr:hypothetical protein [Acidimicrobiales bacterium]
MTTTSTISSAPPDRPVTGRALLNKVPEVTIWFWIIKILCTTVGESFADWVSVDLGVGLINTSLIFTVALAAVLAWQVRLPRYNAIAYWLTVVVLSVSGTLYTDILTDKYGVNLAITTPITAAILAAVFGIWYAKEHTLSIHSITTVPREAFYWLAILVTFALGTAAGDWTLELTGWTPGVAVLLPVGLIAAIVVGWRYGANPVLSFWLAYVLTRPLGANLGDWLAVPKEIGGIGLGTAATSVIFLTAILATVTYLVIRRPDVIESHPELGTTEAALDPVRERRMLAYYGAVAVAAIAILGIANSRPHASFSAREEDAASGPVEQLTPQEATANFPEADITEFRTITQDTIDLLGSGDQAGATARITDLETAWDHAEGTLKPLDETAWTFLDSEVDHALTAVRDSNPDPGAEQTALNALTTSLTP